MNLRLLKFGATWCKPCHAQDEELKRVTGCNVNIFDVEEDADITAEYGVRSVPTLILIDEENNPLRRWTGFTKADVINEETAKYSNN